MSFVNFGAQPELRVDPMLEAKLRKPLSKEESPSRIEKLKRLQLSLLLRVRSVDRCFEAANEALAKWKVSREALLEACEQERQCKGNLTDFARGMESLADALARRDLAIKAREDLQATVAKDWALKCQFETKEYPAAQNGFCAIYTQLRSVASEEFESRFDFSQSFGRMESPETFVARKVREQEIFFPLRDQCGRPELCEEAMEKLIAFFEGR